MGVLEKEWDRLINLQKETKEEKYMYMEYCLNHFFEISKPNYNFIVNYCKNNNIKGIVDIGCAMGYQSQLFLDNDIDYVGVDEGSDFFWNSDKFKYINNKYPCDLSKYKDYLAVSVLCLGWNCYLYEGDKTLIEQFSQLSNDFSRCLLYIQKDNVSFANEYFSDISNINSNFYELIV